jgi:predicted deacylase
VSSTPEVVDVPGEQASLRPRVLGRVRGERAGPTLICIGALHGNEPAGVEGMRRVLTRLRERATHLTGEFVALIGNRVALAEGRRFVDRDLNRAWTFERLERLRGQGRLNGQTEDREQVELLEAIEAAAADARGPLYVLDLHTTSGHGGPFSTFGDTLPNRDFAAHIPVPMILGLEELVDGTLLAFLGSHGMVAVVLECGQHEEPRAADRAEAGSWLAIAAAGLLPEDRMPEAGRSRKLLAGESRRLPGVLEMRYRHDIGPTDGFRMDPGYENFQPVVAGQVVARDARGPVHVAMDARILMPLYQTQGEDGFFLIREFHPLWLRASTILRRLRVDRVAHWLPGVRRDPSLPDALVVDKRVARWGALQLFHLLGFRKLEDAGTRLVMRRRSYDEFRFVGRPPPPESLR